MSVNTEKQFRYDIAYLKMAYEWANLSYCQRKKVGAIIVKNRMIISDGYNGTPSGFENNCEDEEGNTKWHVLHAEANAILKLVANGGMCSKGATLYCTMSPCIDCSKLVLQAKIARVVFREIYRIPDGIEVLVRYGVKCDYLPTTNHC